MNEKHPIPRLPYRNRPRKNWLKVIVNFAIFLTDTVSQYLSPQPPPKNIRIIPLSASIAVEFEPFFSNRNDFSTEVLYRENGTIKPYVANERANVRRIFLALLAPGNDYEVKVATVFPPTGFPSPFITLVNNTYGKSSRQISDLRFQIPPSPQLSIHDTIFRYNCHSVVDIIVCTTHNSCLWFA